MTPIDERTLLFWLGIISIVFIVSMVGMLINRYFIHRAHRKAIEELHPQRVSSGRQSGQATFTAKHAICRASGYYEETRSESSNTQ